AAVDRSAKLKENTRAVLVGIADVQRLVDFKFADVGQPVRRILDAGRQRLCLARRWNDRRCDGPYCRHGAAAQELATPDVDQLVAAFHWIALPIASETGKASQAMCQCWWRAECVKFQ